MLYAFYYLFPDNVVLGNARFNFVESAIYAGFWTTVLLWAMWDYLHVRKIRMDKLDGSFVLFWFINIVSFWLVARFAQITGYGISSFWWAIGLSFFANLLQKSVFKMVLKRRSSLSFE